MRKEKSKWKKLSPVLQVLAGVLLAVGAEVVREKVSEPKHESGDDESVTRLKAAERREPSKGSIHIMRWVSAVVAVAVIAIVAILAIGKTSAHSKKQEALKEQVAKGPQLEVVSVKKAPPSHELVLEAEARPYFQTTIFAKVSGYLREIRVIEGSKVKTGDILGVIDSPETDQAYEAARADAVNKNRIAARSRILLKQRLISAQEAEQSFAEARVASANLRSAKEQKDYEILRAPFDGIVTSRLVDPGALIPNASNAKSAQLAVVNLADTSHLKIDAFIEQRYARDIRVGMPAQIFLPDRASEKFPAHVARVSGVLDPRTRMLFIEMDYDNSGGHIVAGSFVSVSLAVQRPELLQAPIQALVSKNNAPALATLGENNKVKMVPIQIYENDGSNLMISSGVTEGTKIVLDVGAELKEGDSIQPIFPKEEVQQMQAKDQRKDAGDTVSATSQSASDESSKKADGGKSKPQQQPPSTKNVNSSGESQPPVKPQKPSMSNGVYLPKNPPEPNE